MKAKEKINAAMLSVFQRFCILHLYRIHTKTLSYLKSGVDYS